MYIRRNTFTHDNNEATFRFRIEPQYADNGLLVGTKRMAYLKGRLVAADATALSAKVTALEAAYSTTAGDFVLVQNDNSTQTPWKITGSQTVGGIRLKRLEYPNQSPGDWTTYLDYEIDIEADFGGVGLVGGGGAGQSSVISWNESLSFRGTGGPRFIIKELRNGPPQKQIVSQRTPVYCSQRGDAVGLYNYPNPSNPAFPAYEMLPEREISRTSADMVGQSAGGGQQKQRNFRIAWSYSFQAPGYITASPGLGF